MRVIDSVFFIIMLTFTGHVMAELSPLQSDSRLASIAITPPSYGGRG